MELDPATAANLKIAGAALAGGMVRMFLRPTRTLLQTAMLLASCITCGTFGTTPVMRWFDMPDEYVGSVGALLGFIGLSFAEGVLRAVDAFDFRAVLNSLIRTKAG